MIAQQDNPAATVPSSLEPAPLEAVSAQDVEAVRQLLLDSGVDTTRNSASWAEYLQSLPTRFGRWLAEALGVGGEAFASIASLAAWLLIALAIALLAAFVLRAVATRRNRDVPEPLFEPLATSRPAPGPNHWRREVERRLRAGNASSALEAVWRFLASRLPTELPGRAEAHTGREIVTAAGRQDLMPLVRSLEALTYGTRRLDLDDVRMVWRRSLEGVGCDP